MAAPTRRPLFRKLGNLLKVQPLALRNISSATAARLQNKNIVEDDHDSWFTTLLRGGKHIEKPKDSHSRLLANKKTVFEILTHDVKPSRVQEYLTSYGEFVENVREKSSSQGSSGSGLDMSLMGSWMVDVGDQDQAIHIWEYPNYKAVSDSRVILEEDAEMSRRSNQRVPMIRRRKSQICLAFSFWGPVKPRAPGHIYELRSYILKPGTMIEWGNNWARGIRYRQKNDEAVAGFFAQIGHLYNVHHLWAYSDLQVRKDTREAAWSVPGWDDVVAYTVPLMRTVEASILVPNSFSPLK